MALSGSKSGSGTPRLRIDWSATQSIPNNRSTVTAKVYLVADYYINFSATKYGSVTVNGVTKNFSTSSRYSGTGSWLLTTQTFTVNHNSDGTKSFNFSAKYDIKITYSGSWLNTISASGSGTLNTIPRASSVSLLNGSTGEMGKYNDLFIKIDSASSSFTHTLRYSFGNASGTIASRITWVDHEWTVPLDLAHQIPDSISGSGTIYCDTYDSSGNKLGTKSVGFKATVPGSVVPVINTVSIEEAVSGLDAQFGTYVQSKSKLELSMTASGTYGSTIRTYRITANGTSYSSRTATTSELKYSGTNRITFEVTDSRGRKASFAREISVAAYSNPYITSLSAVRSNSDGTENNEGNYAKISYNAGISSVNSKNTKSFKLRYRVTGTTNWTEKVISTTAYSVDSSTVIGGFNVDYAYDIELIVSDYFTTIPLQTTLSTGFTLTNYHPDGKAMAFGEVSDGNGLSVAIENKFKEAPSIIAPTSTDEDGAFLRLKRLDESLLAFLATGVGGTGLKLHMYNGSNWTGYLSIAENGELSINGSQIIQGGSNANGDWVRFYDGTQITNKLIIWNPNNSSMETTLAATYTSEGFSSFVGGHNNDLYSLEEIANLSAGRRNDNTVRIVRNGPARSGLNWNIYVRLFTIGRWK
ncbi:hypothetical protein CHCC20442_4303 [Bacillus licheniformis]|uniref:DUF859 family phage minor structural protein n=1 Tax=Bacillus licheniformis TaxID=1402 RepID=UPI0011A17785|nr:DUF859 family phage minor structural protein [Bacillus licheniformis]TWK08590.1 hypothetical protein CHCC20442_4303 [Bacillus licheniformis]